MAGLVEMYQDYIEGKRKLRDINMGFRTSYAKDDEASNYWLVCAAEDVVNRMLDTIEALEDFPERGALFSAVTRARKCKNRADMAMD